MSRRKIILLAAVLLLFVLVELLLPKPLNWTPTYSHRDKNPFGAYALAQLLPGFLSKEDPYIQSITLYEADTFAQQLNVLSFSEDFMPASADVAVLLRRVSEGDHVFVAAHYWNPLIQDTLGFSTDHHFHLPVGVGGQEPDSINISFTQRELPGNNFRLAANVLTSSFDSLPANATALAKTSDGKVVLAALPWGKGTFYLSSTPLLFTNYFLMQDKTRPYAASALSYLPQQQVMWTEYYHLGRLEAQTPLRFILKEPALRWSYYLGMGILLSFVLFSLKRRQRPIPVVAPPANTSLQFAETVARLYYSQQDHLNIAHKKISYFREWLREHYQLHGWPGPADTPDEEYLQRLVRKSGKPEAQVRSLFSYITKIQQQRVLAPQDLLLLQNKIESFTRK